MIAAIGFSVGTGVLASIIVEVGKNSLAFYNSKNSETAAKKKISKLIEEKLSKEYEELFNSGEFISFLQTPVIKDILGMYIIYKLTGNYKGRLVQIKKKDYPISEKDIKEYLYQELIRNYSGKISKPGKMIVKRFFNEYFILAKEYLLEQLSKEQKQQLIIANNRIDLVQECLLNRLDVIKSEIDAIKKFENPNKDISVYCDTVNEYHRILKTKHSTAHIYLLDSFDFSCFYVPPSLEHKSSSDMRREITLLELRQTESEFDDWKHIFDYNNIVYLTGGAGYGKSLFLKKIINDYEQLNILNSKEYLVIYGDLKAFFDENGRILPLVDYLQASMMKESLLGNDRITKDLVNCYLSSGRCIILLDALDEVDKTKRDDLHSRIISNIKNQNPNNKICITSRNRGFIPAKNIDQYEIRELDDIHIKKYLDNIIKLKKFSSELRDGFLEQSKPLVQKGFLNSFLILSLLINIYRAELDLPANKTELYDKCLDYIAIKRERDKTRNIDWKLITPMMKPNTFIEFAQMCYPNNSDVGKDEIIERLCQIYTRKYSNEAETECAVDELLKFCADRTELFVPSTGEDKYRFFHRSFFEYFYAQYIYIRIKNYAERYKYLRGFDVDSEVQELTLSMLKQKDEISYQQLTDYIFEQAEGSYNDELELKNKCDATNILTQILPIMDDVEYKDRYIELLTKDKDFFLNSKVRIYNQQNIVQLVIDKEEYIERINNTYGDYTKDLIVFAFLKLLTFMRNSNRMTMPDKLPYKYILKRYIMRGTNLFIVEPYKKENDVSELISIVDKKIVDNFNYALFRVSPKEKRNIKDSAKMYFDLKEIEKSRMIKLFVENI